MVDVKALNNKAKQAAYDSCGVLPDHRTSEDHF